MENQLQGQSDLQVSELQIEVSAGPVVKCAHGIYIAAGDEVARHCGMCNPDAYSDGILRAAMARRKPANRIYPETDTLDAAEYLEQSVGERLHAGREFFATMDMS